MRIQLYSYYNIDYKAHKFRITKYEENLVKAYEFLWDRCSLAMRAKVETRKDYDKVRNNPIKLIKAIKEVTSHQTFEFSHRFLTTYT